MSKQKKKFYYTTNRFSKSDWERITKEWEYAVYLCRKSRYDLSKINIVPDENGNLEDL